ncbi:MAG: hypothetical protein K2O53_02865, partial [Bacteroidales bacterium]|nr:hypothetical protein [Bacteroidales bacterium]
MNIKARIISLAAACMLAVATAFAQTAAFKVQGHERTDLDGPQPVALSARAAADGTAFSFDDIRFWVGEGGKRAALVVDWHDEALDHALVWGYRWDGDATGYDMVSAVAAADPRFTLLTHVTQYGHTIAALGYNTYSPYETELVYAPEDAAPVSYKPVNGIVTTDAYNYDDWLCSEPDALWRAGWYKGYWSYQVKDAVTDDFTYSGLGASSRRLTDGSVDGWSYAVIQGSFDGTLPRMPYEAVTPAEPTDANVYWGQMYKNPEHQSIVDLPL